MNLSIITPSEHRDYEIAWLELNTPHGNMIVQRGHIPMIVTLVPNQPITFRLKNGKQETIIPRGAIAEISRESASIIINEITQ